jgi:hypothetical protein
MKRITAIALFAMANFVMAGTSFAQYRGVQATIPFDFTVANKLLPAGTYTITQGETSVITIRSHDKPIAVFSLVDPDDHKSPNHGKLVFNKYGSQYFLSEILCDQSDMHVAVPASKTEKRVRLEQAKLNSSSQTLVATR